MLALGNSVLLSTAHSMDMQNTTQPASTDQPSAEHAIMSPRDKQFCTNLLHSLQKDKHAYPFLEAVDPVKLNIPDYPDIIKDPMDLGTIESKLHNDQYDSIDAFASDIKLMFDNCYLYNGPQDPVSALGRSLQKVFDRGMKKKPGRSFVPAGSMPEDDYYRCEKTIREFKKKKHSEYAWIFSKPVDAEAWGATNYHEIIKTPMDLSTMENKLLDHQYKNEQEFVDDMRLMFQNCYTYNPPMHPVHALGKKFEAVFDAYWEKLHEDNQGDYKKKNNASKGLKRDASSFDSIPSQPKRSRQNVEELGTSQDTKPSVLKLRLPTASLKQNLTPQSTPTSASPVPASNNNHHLHLAISKHPPASQSASSSSTSATSSTNTKRLALSDTKLSTPTKPNAPTSLSLSAQRRPNTTSTTARPQQQHPNARPNEVNKVPPNKMANKLPSKPVPKKPAPQAFDVGVLLDGIAQEKEQREREKRLQQEQQLRFEEKKRENEMRRRQEEELKRQGWRDWATKKKEQDRKARMEALEASPINISRDKLRFHRFEKELSKNRDWHQLYGFHREALQYHKYPMPSFMRNSQRSLSDVRALLLNATFRHRREDDQMHHDDSVQDMDLE